MDKNIDTKKKAGGRATDLGMIWIPGGDFLMGSEKFYPEEAPVRNVRVDGFWIDRFTVTNEKYSGFVAATGYVTVAERDLDPEDFPGAPVENLKPGALVFKSTDGPVELRDYSQWWNWTPGANWRHPFGPESSIADLGQHPVVHIAYEDAEAYAQWVGKELPTEAQWEYAARGGHSERAFTWGDEDFTKEAPMANTWQGEFPWQNHLIDGYGNTAPAGSFPANDYGLFDMAGNVWEWTSDWFAPHHKRQTSKACCGVDVNPRVGSDQRSYDGAQQQFQIPRKVVKGGSFLCAPNYCLRYRPAARQPQMIDTGMSHIGFRCASGGEEN
jgi:sulfatase modifying factor 1